LKEKFGMEKHHDKIEVIGLGQACIDYLGRVPTYPPEDGKMELLDLQMLCGGPASTALVTLSRLGILTTFLGSISDDPLGVAIAKGLGDEKVDTSYLKITPGYTSQFAFIAITKESGTRSIFWHRGSVPHLKPVDIDLSPFSGARVLHFDSLMIEASLEAAQQAKKMGVTIVMDAGTLRNGSLELISLVDVLIASEGFAESLLESDFSPESALKTLKRLCPGDVIITLGSKGSIGTDNEDIVFQKAFPVKAVDTTGAGDVYHGAYVYGLLQGWDMPECMRFASATAALKCMAIGAQKGIPKLEGIKEFLDKA
jgi:ribokinase